MRLEAEGIRLRWVAKVLAVKCHAKRNEIWK